MKILVIGDPHGSMKKLRKIPKRGIDLILLTGDLGKANLARKQAFQNIERRRKGLPPLPEDPKLEDRIHKEIYDSSLQVLRYCSKFAPTYFIYGNVEPCCGERPSKKKSRPWFPKTARKIKGVRIINNQLVNFNGVRIGGLEYFTDTNWVQDFKPSDYKKRMKKAKKFTDKARKTLKRFGRSGIEILLHHQPPYGILDKVGPLAPKQWRGKHAGSKAILDYIKKHQPRYAFCGHIHEGEGHKRIGKTEVYNLGVAGYKIIEIK